MKKLVAIMLVLCMAFSVCSLVSCTDTSSDTSAKTDKTSDTTPESDKGTTPESDSTPESNKPEDKPEPKPTISAYAVISQAIAKTKAAKSYDAKLVVDQTIAMTGMNMEMSVKNETKATGVDGDSFKIASTLTTNMLGTDNVVVAYGDKDWVYYDYDGTEDDYKEKSEGGLEYVLSMLGDPKAILADIPEKYLADVAGSESSLEFSMEKVFSDEEFKELYAEPLFAASGLDIQSVKNGKAKITVSGGYIKSYTIECDLEMEQEGVKMTDSIVYGVTFNSVDGAVTVTPPQGYQSFPEFTFNEDDFIFPEE